MTFTKRNPLFGTPTMVTYGILLVFWVGCMGPESHGQSADTRRSAPARQLISSEMVPGMVSHTLKAAGALKPGYVQPVKIIAPPLTSVSLAMGGHFDDGLATPTTVGLLVGEAYRLKIMGTPREQMIEVYPTVELIDRLHPPSGQGLEFPIPIEFTLDDLLLASAGNLVTRVVYVENPQAAIPMGSSSAGTIEQIDTGHEPLQLADSLGRPVAIIRIGSRVPLQNIVPSEFLFHSPPVQLFGNGWTKNGKSTTNRLSSSGPVPTYQRRMSYGPARARPASWTDQKRRTP